MTEFPVPQCFSCKKLPSLDDQVCSAYPKGIPREIVVSVEKCKYFDESSSI